MASRVSYARDTFSRPLLYLFLATISSYLSIYIYIFLRHKDKERMLKTYSNVVSCEKTTIHKYIVPSSTKISNEIVERENERGEKEKERERE